MRQVWVILILITWPITAISQVFPGPSSPYVNDFANVLSQDARIRITDRLIELKQDQGIDATVVTMMRKSDYLPGVDLEPFATALFNEWGIGDAETNSGILLLYLHEDREVRIELGQSYGQDWNFWAGIVVDDFLVPNFRAGRTEVGLEKGVESIRAEIAIPFVNGDDAPYQQSEFNLSNYIPFAFFALVFGLLGYMVYNGIVWFHKCPKCGERFGLSVDRVPDARGFDSDKEMGTETVSCSKCDHWVQKRYVQSRSKSSSGSSFGGSGGSSSSGGGSSGGGGASRRW